MIRIGNTTAAGCGPDNPPSNSAVRDNRAYGSLLENHAGRMPSLRALARIAGAMLEDIRLAVNREDDCPFVGMGLVE